MKAADVAGLIALAAVWGGSYLFMRIAAPEFGPVALVEVRVVIAGAFLLPFLLQPGRRSAVVTHWRALMVLGLFNSALPFLLIAYATLALSAGFAAILNATAPFFAALAGYLWLRERLRVLQVIGLVTGFAGVVVLSGDAGLPAGQGPWAVAAALAAAALYGWSANYTRKRFPGVDPLVVAGGSVLAAIVLLLPVSAFAMPGTEASGLAWMCAVALGVLSTGAAQVLYFRIIASAGATAAIAVTFLIPAFGMLWGATLLGEPVTPHMAVGAATILAGTAMTGGMAGIRRSARKG